MIGKAESKFISVVVYMRNDRENIDAFMDMVISTCEEYFEKYEIICVDDDSSDGSTEVLKDYCSQCDGLKDSMVNLIHMGYCQGQEASMNAGRDMAIGDFVYEFDDMHVDYPNELIWEVYQTMLAGFDIVAASGRNRLKLTSRIFYVLYNLTSRSGNKIGQQTFRILSRRAINRVKSIGRYIPYRKAVYMNCGLKTETVAYQSIQKENGLRNKGLMGERSNLAMDSFIYFTNVLEQTALVISGGFLLFSIGVSVYVVSSIFSAQKPVEGWVSTMGFLSFGFFGVFILLTIILKYMSVLLNLIFRHQRYLIESIEKISGR